MALLVNEYKGFSYALREETNEMFRVNAKGLVGKEVAYERRYRTRKDGSKVDTGYTFVRLYKGNESIITTFHRLVFFAHNPLLDEADYEDYEVDHINRDRSNNDISNLRLVTKKENLQNRGYNNGK